MKKVYPHIIGIGSAQAGLRLVSELLSEHPAIADTLPARNFFNTSAFLKRGRAWYETALLQSEAGLLCGDCTSGYAIHPEVPQRIASFYPDTKLFIIVRHPLRRLLAEYEALRQIDAAATRGTAAEYLAHHPDLQRRSDYGAQLERFFAYYSPLQLYILTYEDLVADPLGVMGNLYDYYGVDKNFIPKRLRPYASPPDEPKHRSLIAKPFVLVRKLYKKLTYRAPEPVFPPEVDIRRWLSAEEESLFLQAYIPDARHLSTFMSRDMVVAWNLASEPGA